MTSRSWRFAAMLPTTLLMAIAVGTPEVSLAVAPTIVVDTTEDTFDGSCADGDCSLRDAVKSAPAGARVLMPPGFYPLSITGIGGVGEGTIELRRRIEIAGQGETGVFIDASALGAPAFTAVPRNTAAHMIVEHLTVFGAHEDTIVGGAIAVHAGSLRLTSVTIAGGLADRGGGIAVRGEARLTLVDSLVIGNEAASSGGGIWSEGRLTITGSAIVGNLAGDGGGIWSEAGPGATSSFVNVTVAENTATGEGGGMRLTGRASIVATTIGDNQAARGGGIAVGAGSVELSRTIVAGNRAGRARQCDGAVRSGGDNVDRGHGCGFDAKGDLEDVDPGLRRLGPNGGQTPTMALMPGSPAEDLAGDCGGRDQRGAPRDRRCDAGPYEVVRCLGAIVNIVGTPGDDERSGGRGPDAFLGMGGDDELQGSIGKDRACGGRGDDLLIAGPGNDRVDGEAGDDRVRGETGDDVLYGGTGRDRLAGGPGDDACQTDVRDARASGCEVSFTGAARAAPAPPELPDAPAPFGRPIDEQHLRSDVLCSNRAELPGIGRGRLVVAFDPVLVVAEHAVAGVVTRLADDAFDHLVPGAPRVLDHHDIAEPILLRRDDEGPVSRGKRRRHRSALDQHSRGLVPKARPRHTCCRQHARSGGPDPLPTSVIGFSRSRSGDHSGTAVIGGTIRSIGGRGIHARSIPQAASRRPCPL